MSKMRQVIEHNKCRRLLISVFVMILCIPLAFAQQKVKVTGRIVDQKTQEPLIGVSVVERGSSNGIMSDLNGRYQLNVSKGATLTF